MGTPDSPVIRIHEASVDDIETIRRLADRTWRVCYPGIITESQIDYMLGWMYAADRIRREIESEDIRYLLAESPEPSGFSGFGPGEKAGEIFLHKLYVLPEKQRAGIGSALLAAVVEHCEENDISRISLRVNRRNESAIRAYEKNGFQKTNEVCSDIGGGFVMDDFVMTKSLDDRS